MLDYEINDNGSVEVFDCWTGETVANCATRRIALALIDLLEGSYRYF